jgi:hypothetical protein
MTANGADPALVREVLRDVLAELLPELVAETRGSQGPAPISSAVPAMPPPPVAAVHRPSSWRAAPAVAGPKAAGAEEISLTSDAELDAFVRRLLQRFEDPQERAMIRSGALRFTLARGQGASAPPATAERRIDHGAVTERLVREAAAAGSSIRLGPRAVLTPLARDVARALGVTIEKEKRC